MVDDWLQVRISAVEKTANALREALSLTPGILEPARRARHEGAPLTTIAQDLMAIGAEARRYADAAIRAYEQAVTELRADVVRGLIDEEGIPLATVADAMGASRQAVTNLYRLGQSLHDQGRT